MSLGRHQPRRWPDGDRAGCAGLFRRPALHAPLQAPCSFPRLRPSEALPSVAVRTHAPLQGSGCQDHRRELGGGVERDQLGPPPCPWAWQVPLRGCGSAHRSGLAAPQDPPSARWRVACRDLPSPAPQPGCEPRAGRLPHGTDATASLPSSAEQWRLRSCGAFWTISPRFFPEAQAVGGKPATWASVSVKGASGYLQCEQCGAAPGGQRRVTRTV